jgi:hypothetical protein
MNNDQDLTITIETSQGNWDNAIFHKTAKVGDVINAVIEHFNYTKNGNYELRMEKDPDINLKPERPLVSYGINDGDVLIFTDLGGGV